MPRHLDDAPESAQAEVIPKNASHDEYRRPVPRRLLVWLSCGVAGTLLFPFIYLIEGAVRPGYNPWDQAISSLSLGPGGWVQRIDFILCGISVLLLATIFRQVLRGGPCATAYPIIRAIEGLGLIMIGFFSTDPVPGYPPGTTAVVMTVQGGIHLAFTIVVVNMMALGLFVIARRFWNDPEFPGWSAFSIAAGLLTFVFMTAFGLANATHRGYAGVYERLATNTDTVWGAALLFPLWTGRKFVRSGANSNA